MQTPEAVPDCAESLLQESAWLRGLVVHLLGDAREVDDVVQDVRLAALKQGPPARSLRGWLAAVARHTIQRRQRRARMTQHFEGVAARPEALASAHDVVARVEAQRKVVEAVLALEEPYRSAILLRFFDKFNNFTKGALAG